MKGYSLVLMFIVLASIMKLAGLVEWPWIIIFSPAIFIAGVIMIMGILFWAALLICAYRDHKITQRYWREKNANRHKSNGR